MLSTIDRCRLALIPVIAMALACSGGIQTQTDAGMNAPADAGQIHFGTDAGPIDAGPNDAGMNTDGCVPESDQDLCASDYDECGTPTITDSCGTTRTPNCGACGEHAACDPEYFYCSCETGYSGDGKTCAVCTAETDEELCASDYDECGSPTITDSCGTIRTPNCGTCGEHASCDPDYYYCYCEVGYSGDGQTCDVCTPESDADFCYENYAECGPLNWYDSCGFERTVDCGNCSGHGTCDYDYNFCTCDQGFSDNGVTCVASIGLACATGDGQQHDCPEGQVCTPVGGVNICTIVGCTSDTECGANDYYANSCVASGDSTYCHPHCNPGSPTSCGSPDMVCVSLYPTASGGSCQPSCRLQSSAACAATYATTCDPFLGSCELTTCNDSVPCPAGQACVADATREPAWKYCVADCRAQNAEPCPDGRTCDVSTGACVAAQLDGGSEDGGTTLPDGGTCVPETDEELCAAADAYCGHYERRDSCGHVRTPNCGDCAANTYCDRELLKCTCSPGTTQLDGGSCGVGIGQTCAVGDNTQQDCPAGQVCVANGTINLCTIANCTTAANCGTNGWRSNSCTTDGYCVPSCDPSLGPGACGSDGLICYPTSTYAGNCYLDCRLAAEDYCSSSAYGAACDPATGRCTYSLCGNVVACETNEVCYEDTSSTPSIRYCLPNCNQGAVCPTGRTCNQTTGVCEATPATP